MRGISSGDLQKSKVLLEKIKNYILVSIFL
jgi:hypothetical protein